MPKYQLKATQDWDYGEISIKAGQVVGEIESDLAPFLLVEGERSGRLQVQQVEEKPAAAEKPESSEGVKRRTAKATPTQDEE